MNEVHIDDINENYNFMILSNQSYRLLSEKYELTTNMLEEADFISGMGYNLLETIDQELKNIIYKINKLKQNLDSKELAFMLMFDSFNESKLFAINKGEIESIINRYNKSSYAFYCYKNLKEFIKYNNLYVSFKKENLLRIISDTENVNKLIIELYSKFKNKEYEYLDEFIIYIKNRLNEIIKRK